jgi:hypothetical protein
MPAGSTYTPIETKTLASNTTTVTFSSIPSTYTDLVLVFQAASVAANGNAIRMRFNGSSASEYSSTFVDGTGANIISARTGTQTQLDLGWRTGVDSSTWNNVYVMNFQNYKSTSMFKPILWTCGGTSTAVDLASGLWRNNAAINSISMTVGNPSSTDFIAGCVFTLYGITAA